MTSDSAQLYRPKPKTNVSKQCHIWKDTQEWEGEEQECSGKGAEKGKVVLKPFSSRTSVKASGAWIYDGKIWIQHRRWSPFIPIKAAQKCLEPKTLDSLGKKITWNFRIASPLQSHQTCTLLTSTCRVTKFPFSTMLTWIELKWFYQATVLDHGAWSGDVPEL